MTWGNPPRFTPSPPRQGKRITPKMLAASGSEDGEQAALFCWAADNVGAYPQLKWLFAIPNGGSRHIAEATKMVAGGVRSGVPDIFLPVPFISMVNRNYFGCFIEMKVGKNVQSKDQEEWFEYLTKAGYYCRVCYSWQKASVTLISYLEGRV